MIEQKYIIRNQESFELKHIFDCGQCFRWNEEEDKSYTGVFKGNVLNVKKENDTIAFKGIVNGDIKEVVEDYFDLKRDYTKIKKTLSKVDINIKKGIKYGEGIRILNQDLIETILSFIISANNNIPRIKGIIERLSKNYGEKIVWNKKNYYTFPSLEQLKDVSIQEYRKLGLGFRDKRKHHQQGEGDSIKGHLNRNRYCQRYMAGNLKWDSVDKRQNNRMGWQCDSIHQKSVQDWFTI